MKQLQITSLWSGGLITNYYCSSRCRHCLYACSPNWERMYIDKETAANNFAKIRELNCRSIHIGGGEPLLNAEKLANILDTAQNAGIGIDYVETNSSWFRDSRRAADTLSELKSKGLTTLLVSMSPFHNEFIPFYKVKGVQHACRATGINVFPWIEDFYQEVDAFDDSQTHSLEEYEEKFGKGYSANAARRYYLAFRGRALNLIKPYLTPLPFDKILAANNVGCRELEDTSHFHVDLFGNFIPGLCSGLALQRDDLGKPVNPEKYPFIARLFDGGIQALYQYAAERFGFQPQAFYVSKCEVCMDIRRFLVIEKQVDSKDLQPVEYYAQI